MKSSVLIIGIILLSHISVAQGGRSGRGGNDMSLYRNIYGNPTSNEANSAPQQLYGNGSNNYNNVIMNFDNAIQTIGQTAQQAVQSKQTNEQSRSRGSFSIVNVVQVNIPISASLGMNNIELPKPKALNIKTDGLQDAKNIKIPVTNYEYRYRKEGFSFRKNIYLPVYRWHKHHFTRRPKTKGVRMSCFF